MPSVSRRGFLRWTSVGIAATGVIGALAPVGALAATPAQDQPLGPNAPMPPLAPRLSPAGMPMVGGEPFVVYVSDPATGAGSILVGERSIPFTNGAIVQTLRQAIG